MDDIIEDIKANTLNQYNYYGMNITLPAEVIFIYPWSLAVLTIFIVAMVVYIFTYSALPEELYRRLALQHLFSGYLHVACLTLYNIHFGIPFLDSTLDDAYSSLDLIITITTACVSWIVFLRVFLFRNGEELYTLKQVMVFSTLSLAVIEVYEWLMSIIDVASSMQEALRLTSILLIMSVPLVVMMLLVKSLMSSSSDVPKFQALFFIAYLLMFVLSDVWLLRFNLHCESTHMLLWSIFLFLRLVVEMVLYIVFDRYLSNFFTY